MALAGHKSIATTQRYIELNPTVMKAAMIYYRKTLFGRGPKLTAVQSGFNVIWSLFKDLSTFPYSI